MTRSNGGSELKKTVLVADDQPSVRRLVSITITSDQYEVLEAKDGEEAWRLAEQYRPVVAVLDVRMPGRSGLDVTRAIKANPDLARTHVILLTAHGREADVRAGLEAGADLYLTKPFSPLQLLTAVEEALARA